MRAAEKVSDPYLPDVVRSATSRAWTPPVPAPMRSAPVQTRLSYYASSKRARAILGQPRSTIDLRRTILDGGILLVSTAQGAAGRDVAALVGSSILNLVDAVIREQGELPPEQRRGALVVVDEMQSMPGVDYESMLSELGKFGAALVLATQSLDKLDELSPTMRTTVLANIGCLAVFQVAGSDARQLVWELDRERVSEEDIVSLPVHHAYVRATVGSERTARLLDGGAQARRGLRGDGGAHPRRGVRLPDWRRSGRAARGGPPARGRVPGAPRGRAQQARRGAGEGRRRRRSGARGCARKHLQAQPRDSGGSGEDAA